MVDRQVLSTGVSRAQSENPPLMVITVSVDYVDVVGSDNRPVAHFGTGISVVLARISLNSLECLGSRCCTSTNAMQFLTELTQQFGKASSPPAEAPIPTMKGRRAGAAKRSSPAFRDLFYDRTLHERNAGWSKRPAV